mmetsp:Transcript_9990/g.40497  ORF Transcript_9990/g.40497 Transcript_9990/m.40497 type:complete len:209 (+) Transcript_9990:2202-2828(+)
MDRQRLENTLRDGERELECVRHVEYGFLVLLEVLVVRGRQRRHERGQLHRRGLQPRRLAAQQFEGVGIPFVRHQRGARRVRRAERDVPKLLRPVHDEVFGPPREVRPQKRRPLGELDAKVAVGDGVERIRRAAAAKAEIRRQRRAVARSKKWMPGERARPQRRTIGPLEHVIQSLGVARPGPRVRQHEMRPPNRLRALEMRIPGENRV